MIPKAHMLGSRGYASTVSLKIMTKRRGDIESPLLSLVVTTLTDIRLSINNIYCII